MKVGVGYGNEQNAFAAGRKASEQALKKGAIQRPDLVFAFCPAQLDQESFFQGVQSAVGKDTPILGGSAIGIITNDDLSYEGFPVGAAILQSDALRYRLAVAEGLDRDENAAGRQLGERLSDGLGSDLMLLFYDSIKLAGTTDSPPVLNASTPLIQGLEQGFPARLPVLIGAGLVGDYALNPTYQFCGSQVASQSAVGLMLRGDFKIYFRIMHGCTPLDGVYHTISRMDGSVIYELDGKPAVSLIDELYGNQDWRQQRPVHLLTLGRNLGGRFEFPQEDHYVNRLITGALPGGQGIAIFEPDFEEGTEVQFMLRDTDKILESARRNALDLMSRIEANHEQPCFGLYIDCAGRTASYSNTDREEAAEIQTVFNRHQVPLFGFYSGVEIAPLLQKPRGLDWTGVLLVFAKG